MLSVSTFSSFVFLLSDVVWVAVVLTSCYDMIVRTRWSERRTTRMVKWIWSRIIFPINQRERYPRWRNDSKSEINLGWLWRMYVHSFLSLFLCQWNSPIYLLRLLAIRDDSTITERDLRENMRRYNLVSWIVNWFWRTLLFILTSDFALTDLHIAEHTVDHSLVFIERISRNKVFFRSHSYTNRITTRFQPEILFQPREWTIYSEAI